jgi:hypothetical protein
MAGLEYQHIGHDPTRDAIAIWSVDDQGRLHEDRKERHQPTVEWLGWSHERVFPHVKVRATGRVELGQRAGSIHISDVKVAASPARMGRLLEVLDATYPKTKWFLFGAGYRGDPVNVVLGQPRRVA